MKQKQKVNDYLFIAEAISFYLNFLGITCMKYSDLIAGQIKLHWLRQIPNEQCLENSKKGALRKIAKFMRAKTKKKITFYLILLNYMLVTNYSLEILRTYYKKAHIMIKFENFEPKGICLFTIISCIIFFISNNKSKSFGKHI